MYQSAGFRGDHYNWQDDVILFLALSGKLKASYLRIWPKCNESASLFMKQKHQLLRTIQ